MIPSHEELKSFRLKPVIIMIVFNTSTYNHIYKNSFHYLKDKFNDETNPRVKYIVQIQVNFHPILGHFFTH
jgi:hypothetical protein